MRNIPAGGPYPAPNGMVGWRERAKFYGFMAYRVPERQSFASSVIEHLRNQQRDSEGNFRYGLAILLLSRQEP